MTAKHTPTPWQEGPRYGNLGVEIVARNKPLGMFYAYTPDTDTFDPEGLANLRYAIKACNTQDKLVGLFEEVWRQSQDYLREHSGDYYDLLSQMEAVRKEAAAHD